MDTPLEPAPKLYRYHSYRVATGMSYDGEYAGSQAAAYLQEFKVIKTTKQGRRIDIGGSSFHPDTRWVSNTSRKRYAHPTKAEAWTSFLARKRRQVSILKAQLRNAEEALTLKQP